ncbi:MAG TPA: methyltransferase domain-containing protein [Bryobacteraceae bacterium]|nr:methyltransferase domain-containing protein [Bryobacteraceae bacterium]
MDALDSPDRIAELRAMIDAKAALRRFYTDIYARYTACLAKCPKEGLAVELGSGGGFVQQIIPELVTTDVLHYDGLDRVVDATQMVFANHSVRFFGMLNVFHHIPDAAAFLREAGRCLAPGGRLLIIDQHPGWISKPILRYLHHEPFRPDAKDWRFESTGPLSGANGAMAWIVFVRDRPRFTREFSELQLHQYRPFAPLAYWLSGGLRPWSLLPSAAYGIVNAIDHALLRMSTHFGSFVEIEIIRR